MVPARRPRGLLRPDVDPDVVTMICTAGHVDHGKTSLVRLLTGCNTDRLKAEQERGMTIELGFAPCFLGGTNLCAGIVDVPGHEKFVRNMVAGVSGIDMALLVIAADDGVMPQTVEHLQIMELLGVRRGMVALTKTDLVSPERVEEVRGEIAVFLTGTFMEGAVICPVSSETWDGYAEFYQALVDQVGSLSRRRAGGVFRMPVERVFAREGFGTVVTGIPVDGVVSVGDAMEIVPGGGRAKVRGIQRFLRQAERGGCGQCLALNLAEADRMELRRGQVIASPGYLEGVQQLHVRVSVLAGADRPLRNAEEVKFHSGTTEETARVYLLESRELGGGGSGLATLMVAQPVAAAPHDRFILRRPSPALTFAGGEIVAVAADTRREPRAAVAAKLHEYLGLLEGARPGDEAWSERRIAAHMQCACPDGAAAGDIARACMLPRDAAGIILQRMTAAGQLRLLPPDSFIHSSRHAAFVEAVRGMLARSFGSERKLAVNIADMRRECGVKPSVCQLVLAELRASDGVRVEGDRVLPPLAQDPLAPAERALAERIDRIYREAGFGAPRADELPSLTGASAPAVERALQCLANEKRIVRLAHPVILSIDTLRRGQQLAIDAITKHGELDSADFKHHIASSRKYALAILDYLDGRRVTIRIGNRRKLAPGYEKRQV